MNNILFVCTANICRSPFAENAFKMILRDTKEDGIKVHSAGVNALPGFTPPSEAIRIAREFGVDVSEHTSRSISIGMIKEADIILVMDLFHIEKILKIEGESYSKLKLLGGYSTTSGHTPEENEIPDPYGFTSFHYRSSFNIILDCLYNLYKELFNNPINK
ncbi:MAG: low molecular weight protein arginine phosphatase [Thermodesulfobacteriota bacterium]|nr:low molecular weight protein arginine phosphatase [Thermodesulfobacteriota bacterium]